jgi:hypothetical protein
MLVNHAFEFYAGTVEQSAEKAVSQRTEAQLTSHEIIDSDQRASGVRSEIGAGNRIRARWGDLFVGVD